MPEGRKPAAPRKPALCLATSDSSTPPAPKTRKKRGTAKHLAGDPGVLLTCSTRATISIGARKRPATVASVSEGKNRVVLRLDRLGAPTPFKDAGTPEIVHDPDGDIVVAVQDRDGHYYIRDTGATVTFFTWEWE